MQPLINSANVIMHAEIAHLENKFNFPGIALTKPIKRKHTPPNKNIDQ